MNVDHLLRQSCDIYTAGAQDRFGKNAYGSAITYPCRFQSTSRIIQLPNGEKTPIDGVVWLSSIDSVAINDKMVFAGSDFRIMMISPMIDGMGVTRHYELLVQKWST